MTYDELGPYKYLLRMSLDGGVRDSHQRGGRAARRLRPRASTRSRARSRSSSAAAATSARRREALYVHPNTLRQRLRRIMELSGLDLRRDDWLMVEIAVKLVKLQEALGTAPLDTSGPARL